MRRIRILLVIAAVCVGVGVLVPSAGAVGVRLPDGQFFGIMLQRGVSPAKLAGSLDRQAPLSSPFSPLRPQTEPTTDANGDVEYNGGPVLHTTSPYLVFWDPSGALTTKNRQVLEQYLTDVATDTAETGDTYGVGRQYYDSAGYADAGQTFSAATQAIVDTRPYPGEPGDCVEPAGFTACVDDGQVQAELTRLIAADQLPTDGASSESEFPAGAPTYFVILPPATNECISTGDCLADTAIGGDFCAYHSNYTDGAENVLYGLVPFGVFTVYPPKACQSDNPANTAFQAPNGDEADQIADDLSHELNEAITDPVGTAWVNYPTGDGQELADNCDQYGVPADPGDGFSPDAYAPTLGGNATPVPPDPYGTLYDQLINSHGYYTQSLWSNGDTNCELQTPTAALAPSFTAPATAMAGASVSFNPAASTSAAGFSSATWSFGDGSAPQFTIGSPATVTHSYTAPGDYMVTLSVVDIHGNLATTSTTILIGSPVTISELRLTGGQSAPADVYVELYNHSGSALSLNGWVLHWQTQSGVSGSTALDDVTLPAGGHYLLATEATYSLGSVATPDENLGLPADSGGLTGVSVGVAGQTSDSVGYVGSAYADETGLTEPVYPAGDGTDVAFVRRYSAGVPVDTGDNAADFVLVAPDAMSWTGGSPVLGTASPLDSRSPLQVNVIAQSALLDPSESESYQGTSPPPNLVYEPPSSGPVSTGNPGTLIVYRSIVNTSNTTATPETIMRLQIRLTGLSTYGDGAFADPANPSAAAVLSDVSTPAQSVTGSTSCVDGGQAQTTTLAGTGDGGLNSILSVPLPPGGLTPGECVNVAIGFTVDHTGPFAFAYNLEDDLEPDTTPPTTSLTTTTTPTATTTTTSPATNPAPAPTAMSGTVNGTGVTLTTHDHAEKHRARKMAKRATRRKHKDRRTTARRHTRAERPTNTTETTGGGR
ncbi:MAG: PKD domain-containing protein [Solirubrobacteraceae bacterium]